jgi:hypothetical protein
MTTEHDGFDFFDRSNVATGQKYPDIYAASTSETIDGMAFQIIEYPSVPTWYEPVYAEPEPIPEPTPVHHEPQTPSWSYAANPLFATLPPDIQARVDHESTPFYENLANQSVGDRLIQRVQEQTVETPDAYRSIYHQLEAEQSVGSTGQMMQGLRFTETVPEPQPQPELAVHAADLPTSNAAYYAPVPLWDAPLRVSDGNVGLERKDMRGPLPDTLTPRLETPVIAPQEALAPVAAKTFAHAETATEEVDMPQVLPGASTALLARLAEQAAHVSATPDNEATQVISTADLARTVAKEEKISAGQQLTARVTAEATVATLEQKPAKTIRSYGQTLLEAAGFRFRIKRDETGEGYRGEIVDSEGTVQIDKIDMSKNAEGERMRTTRRLIGRMARLGMKIPKLPSPRIA